MCEFVISPNLLGCGDFSGSRTVSECGTDRQRNRGDDERSAFPQSRSPTISNQITCPRLGVIRSHGIPVAVLVDKIGRGSTNHLELQALGVVLDQIYPISYGPRSGYLSQIVLRDMEKGLFKTITRARQDHDPLASKFEDRTRAVSILKHPTATMNGHSEHNDDVEKGRMEGLDKIRTATSVNMSSELFEKLYLSPPNRVKGDLRKTFGNPTPMSVFSAP